MATRTVRIAVVVLAAGLATQACYLAKKKTGTGTNLGSGLGSSDDDALPPPGTPTFR